MNRTCISTEALEIMRGSHTHSHSRKDHMMKTTRIAFLFLVTCSSCALTLSDRKSSMVAHTWTFGNTTLSEAIDDIWDHNKWGTYHSFRVRNDREFERLVFKNVVKPVALLREIEAKIDCKILEAGRSAIIILPELESPTLPEHTAGVE